MHACMCVHQVNSVVPDSMDYSLPDSSIHRILQARILEWVAMPSFRGSSQPRDRTWVFYGSCIAGNQLNINWLSPVFRDFPGSPVAKTLCFHWVMGSTPGQETKTRHAPSEAINKCEYR